MERFMKTYLTLCFILFALPSWAGVCKFPHYYFELYEPTRYIYKNYKNGKKEGTWIIKQDDIIFDAVIKTVESFIRSTKELRRWSSHRRKSWPLDECTNLVSGKYSLTPCATVCCHV